MVIKNEHLYDRANAKGAVYDKAKKEYLSEMRNIIRECFEEKGIKKLKIDTEDYQQDNNVITYTEVELANDNDIWLKWDNEYEEGDAIFIELNPEIASTILDNVLTII